MDLLPYLSGDKPGEPHDMLFWRQGAKTALRKGDWKLVRHHGNGRWELYDLAGDQEESTDLAGLHPEILGDLLKAWEALNGQMMKPIF